METEHIVFQCRRVLTSRRLKALKALSGRNQRTHLAGMVGGKWVNSDNDGLDPCWENLEVKLKNLEFLVVSN